MDLLTIRQIADRLCGSIGQDIIDCLFSRSTLEVISHRKRPTSHTLRPLFFFVLALVYTGVLAISQDNPLHTHIAHSIAHFGDDLPDDLFERSRELLRPRAAHSTGV